MFAKSSWGWIASAAVLVAAAIAVLICNAAPVAAVTIDTTGGYPVTASANIGSPGGTTIIGSGPLTLTGTGTIGLDNQGGGHTVTMSMTGGTIDVQSGVNFQNGGWQGGVWTNNLSSMNVAGGATFDVWDGNPVNIDALNGAGTVTIAPAFGTNWAGGRSLTIGVNNGSGLFSGMVAGNSGSDGGSISITKAGSGTETFTGANTYNGGTTVNGGRLVIQNDSTGSPNFTTNSELEFNVTSGQIQLAGGTINGTGNLIKTGGNSMLLGGNGAPQTMALTGANSVIDVQGGLLRNEFGNSAWGGNKAALNVAGGAIFDLWDGDTTVDYLGGNGTINKGSSSSNTLTFGSNNGSGTFNGVIYDNRTDLGYGGNGGGSLSLVKTGSGTQTLTGLNTAAGYMRVDQGTLALAGSGQLTPSQDFYIGSFSGPAGHMIMTDNSLVNTNGGWFSVGRGGNSNGLLEMSGNSLLNSRYDINVGTDGNAVGHAVLSGSARMSQREGWTFVGRSNNSQGTVDMSGSSVYEVLGGDMNLGTDDSSSGTLNMTDNSVASSRYWFFMGRNSAASSGALNMSGNSQIKVGWTGSGYDNGQFHAGNAGSAVINLSGNASISSADWLEIGVTGGTATATMSGSSSLNPNRDGGGNAFVGSDPGGVGFLTMNQNSSVNSPNEFWVGQYHGTGTMVMNDSATLNVGSWLVVGRDHGVGTLTINGGTINKTGGGNIIAGSLSGTGLIVQNGGYVSDVGNTLVLGENGGPGTYQLSGGTIATQYVETYGGGSTSTFNFNGGTLRAAADQGGFMQGLNAANVQDGGAIIDSNGHNITINQTLVSGGSGGLTKIGGGILTLTGNNTYTGGTTVNQGTIVANNDSALGNGNILVGSAGTLTYDTTNGDVNPVATTITGSGTMNIIGNHTLVFGRYGSGHQVNVNLSAGANIDVQSGYLETSAYGEGFWYNNQASMFVAPGATVGLKEHEVVVDALNGGGTLSQDYGCSDYPSLVVGVANGSGTFSGAIIDNGNQASLQKSGSGIQVLSGYNTYSGGTTVNSGTLTLAIGGSTGAIRGPLVINLGACVSLTAVDALGWGGGQSVTTLSVSGGVLDNATGGNNGYITNYVLTGGTMTSSGGGLYNLTNGYGVTTNASSATSVISSGINVRDTNDVNFNVAQGTAASGIDLLVSGSITGNAITKTGAGVMQLAGNSTYAGGTTVNAGILQLGNSAALGTGALAANGGTLDLAGNSILVPSFSGAAGVVTNNGANDALLTVDQGSTTTFSGSLTDGPTNKLSLSLTGSGELVLIGTNTFTGGTTVADGTLILQDAAALADGSSLTVGDALAFAPAPVVPSLAVSQPLSITAVPEPGTILLLTAAGLAALAVRRKKRSR